MKLAIVIPAYNEEKAIGDVLKSLPKKITGIDEIISIVVDDGSKDGTYDKARPLANYAIRHVLNLGQGAAMVTGFELAKKIKSDVIITIDADGQHNPKDIQKLIEPILRCEADVVSGSRMHNSKGMPKFKIFGNFVMNLITFMVYNKWMGDSQSGMRAFSANSLSKIKLSSMGHEVCSEMIGEAKRNKLKIIEVPIETIYTEYSKRKGQDWINGINILTRLITIKIAGRK